MEQDSIYSQLRDEVDDILSGRVKPRTTFFSNKREDLVHLAACAVAQITQPR